MERRVNSFQKPRLPKRLHEDHEKENIGRRAESASKSASFKFKRFIIDDAEFSSGYPLRKLSLALDIENRRIMSTLQTEIEKLGGTVVFSLMDHPTPILLVSDHPSAQTVENLNDPLRQLDDRKLHHLPKTFRNAWELGVRVRSAMAFEKILGSIKLRKEEATRTKFGLDGGNSKASAKVGPLNWPCIKIDFMADDEPSCSNQDRVFSTHQPTFAEFEEKDGLPMIYLGNHTGASLFDEKPKQSKSRKTIQTDQADALHNCAAPFEKLDDSIGCEAFLTEGSDKELQCELCNVNVELAKKEEHYESASHLARVTDPRAFCVFDEFLGLREDYADAIQLPPTIPKRIWPKEENEANRANKSLQDMDIDELFAEFITRETQSKSEVQPADESRGDRRSGPKLRRSLCDIIGHIPLEPMGDEPMGEATCSTQPCPPQPGTSERKPTNYSEEFAILLDALKDAANSMPCDADTAKTLCSMAMMDDIMMNLGNLYSTVLPENKETFFQALKEHGMQEILDRFIDSLEPFASADSKERREDLDKSIEDMTLIAPPPVDTSNLQGAQKYQLAIAQPDFDLYKEFFS